MTFLRNGLTAALFLLCLAACNPVAVTGPCTVESDSLVTLEIRWGGGGSIPVVTTKNAQVNDAIRKLASAAATRAAAPGRRIQADDENDTMLIAVDVPAGWTINAATWEATIGGETEGPAAATVLVDAPFCGPDFGTPRTGYTRHFFQIIPDSAIGQEDTGILSVTYQTGTLLPGVYHPQVQATLEPATDGTCYPGAAFHRVTVGSPVQVAFDISSHFNSDIVVNNGDGSSDTSQTPILVDDTGSWSFATQSVAADFGEEAPGLPDDGLVDPQAVIDLFTSTPFPYILDLPECLPTAQLGYSNDSDGDNAWVSQEPGDAVTFDVPAAKYGEVTLYLAPAGLNLSGALGSPEELLASFAGVHVVLTYDDDSTDEVDAVITPAGLPFLIPPGVSGIALEPSMPLAFTLAVPSDGSASDSAPVLGGITALMLSPDTTKTLSSVTVTPVPIDGLITPSGEKKVAANAEAIAPLALMGAAGAALNQADVQIEKSLVSEGLLKVGGEIHWRLTVRNEGADTSTTVTVTDDLPESVSYVSASASSGSCSESGGTVTCNVGTLDPDETQTVDIVARILTPGEIVNTATAVTEGGELDTTDNSASVAAAALPQPVPFLSAWALAALGVALGFAAWLRMRS
jgi:uncharacterized repeat protein (TIGR01451 family)